jgi:hypothetical protein
VNAIAPMARSRMTDRLLGDMHDWLDPELVAPVAAWLARERCSVTGEVFTVGGGRVGRVFVGVTPGFFKPGPAIEDVDAHLDEIRDEAGYLVSRRQHGRATAAGEALRVAPGALDPRQ